MQRSILGSNRLTKLGNIGVQELCGQLRSFFRSGSPHLCSHDDFNRAYKYKLSVNHAKPASQAQLRVRSGPKMTTATITNATVATVTAIPECLSFSNHPERCDVVVGIRRAMASLSFVGCVFCLVVIWAYKKYSIFSQRVVMWLTVAAMFDSVSYLMGDQHNTADDLCIAQAFLMMYFDWAALLWVCCISFNLFVNVIFERATDRLEIFYHLVSWGIPLIMACVPFSKSGAYGPAGAWCWITDDHHDLRFGAWYIPVWTAAFSLAAAYIYIIWSLRKQVRQWKGTYNPETERMKELLRQDIQGLKYYPLVYLLLSIFPTVNRIHNAVEGEGSTEYGLLILHALFNPLQGFFNAIIFAFDKETRSRLTVQNLKAAVHGQISKRHSVHDYPSVGCSDQTAIVDEQEEPASTGDFVVITSINPVEDYFGADDKKSGEQTDTTAV